MFRFVVAVLSIALIIKTGQAGENIGFFASVGIFFATYVNDYIKLKEEGIKKECLIRKGTSVFCIFICSLWFLISLLALMEFIEIENRYIIFSLFDNTFNMHYSWLVGAVFGSYVILNLTEFIATTYIRRTERIFGQRKNERTESEKNDKQLEEEHTKEPISKGSLEGTK